MSWFYFYLVGFMVMFCTATVCAPYEELSDRKSKFIYVTSILILSAFSWVSFLMCIYGAYAKNDK